MDESDWIDIKPPKKSYFMGFDPPTDTKKWEAAIQIAISGKLVLLEKVLQQIKYPEEIVSGDTRFGWLQRMSDILVSNQRHPEQELKSHTETVDRAPIVHLGYRQFEDEVMQEGRVKGWHPIGFTQLLNDIKQEKFTFPRKFVAIGEYR